MGEQTVNLVESGKPTCVTLHSDRCNLDITYYQQPGETPEAFAKRIKLELAEFEKNWG